MTSQRSFFNLFNRQIQRIRDRLAEGKGFEVVAWRNGQAYVIETLGIHDEELLSLTGYPDASDRTEASMFVGPFIPEFEVRFFSLRDRKGRKQIGFSVEEEPAGPD